jgi:hypothetical protein
VASSADSWIVAAFSAERGFGTIVNDRTREERTFQLEDWIPCDPATARALQDSEQRRGLLLPVAGEAVSFDGKRVARKTRVDVLPSFTFADWFARLAEHVPELAGWGNEEWNDWLSEVDGDLDDVVFSAEKARGERHLAVLAVLREQGPLELVNRRLAWLFLEERPGTRGIECEYGDGFVFVALSDEVVHALHGAGLVYLNVG